MRPPEPAILGRSPPPWSCLPRPPVRASALAAGATDSVQRIHRLLGPAEPLGRARRQLLRAAAAALALTPVLLALTPALVALALGRIPAA